MIHSTAVIAPGAQIGENVEIAPFAVIDSQVKIGDNCKIGPHVYLSGDTTIGANTEIHAGANVGDAPQDLHYHGEHSCTKIGSNCIIREYVTIHRGTEEGSCTVVGNNVLLMAMSHLGHNCQISDDVVIANASLLAGRVEVGPHAFISGGVLVHQFVRIGRFAMIGGGNGISQDVPPFALLQDNLIQGPNVIGLRRAGFTDVARNALHDAMKIYFGYGYSRPVAVEKIRQEVTACPEVDEFIEFIMSTKRGISPGYRIESNK